MKTNKSVLATLALGALIFSSCEKEHGHVHNEHEVMTTLTYTLTAPTDTVALKFIDLDGEGGNEPTITGGTLKANTTYAGSIEILNESNPDDVENVTIEVKEEEDEHQFFFVDADNINIAYDDTDSNGKPVGLKTTIVTGEAGQGGTITVTLIHEPNKLGEGVSDGNIDNAGGSTDISVIFPVNVE
jgi:hypothetical protein